MEGRAEKHPERLSLRPSVMEAWTSVIEHEPGVSTMESWLERRIAEQQAIQEYALHVGTDHPHLSLTITNRETGAALILELEHPDLD